VESSTISASASSSICLSSASKFAFCREIKKIITKIARNTTPVTNLIP
jgi:hypothetical protein